MALEVFGITAAADAERKKQNDAKNAGNAEQQRAQREQQRLEEKYGTLSSDEVDREQRQFGIEKDRESEYRRRASKTGQELIGEEGSVNQRLIDEIMSRQGLSGEELYAREGDLNRKIGQEALNDDPLAWLSPELELARTSVNAEANRRGVFGGQPEGGIRFEQLGRANVDLAVKAAAERIAQRNALASQYLNLGANNRSDAGTLAERSLNTKERARGELQDFLSGQQNQTANARGRVANVGINSANIADRGIERGYNTRIDVLGEQAGIMGSYKERGLDFLGDLAKSGVSAATGGAGGAVGGTQGLGSVGRIQSLSGGG